MCGIAGWIDWQVDISKQQAVLQDMAQTLIPRGPDSEGIWTSTHAGFAHRRLIVIDPEGGVQPMTRTHAGETYTIVYNGELYNTDDLRKELIARGHRFQTTSDTEVLLVSYIEWGPECLKYLNGIYAFAIWAHHTKSVFLARDRLGVKPLFYTQQGTSFIFASEIKALLAHPAIKPEITQEGLGEIFGLGPARTPGIGVFHNIFELLPASCLLYTRYNMKIKSYWALESHEHPDDLETTIATIRHLLGDSIKRQLVADVPVCTLLSGGIDSSAISAFAAQAFKEKGYGPLHTFSIDYVDNDIHFHPNEFQPNPDAPWAKRVSEYLGTIHHNVYFDTPHLIDSLQAALRARDLPGMTDVDGSLYLFCGEIKKEATVALSGECADELFGGYPWFHREEALTATIFPWARNLKEKMQFFSSDLLSQIDLEDYTKMRYQEALDEVPHLKGENTKDARIREMFYLNLTRWMPTLLDRKDRMSMAVGLEVRVPFCDHRLVEYMWNVPWSMKTYGGREKGILRQALHGLLPDDVLMRRKSPYPKTHNPSYLAAVCKKTLQILDDNTSPILPFINVRAVKEFAALDLASIHMPWFGQLMNVPQFFAYLIQLDHWMREYKVIVK
ncbi:asparagine synthetase B [Aneurinibacillus sp. XH2]|uniref:asparagine synthase (glutamine-hydrolyzing) n=1 Tax=Aneurinibacillus sp. XH2 TaxID=1450761 RepID=UPI00070ED916|nr:asparagine synthase (glutamine-hydrolyzing) [Aneurinibacillus sp. XH2]AMA71572.1 asparagine synthetase B [Aneurinibacillus sp. XH2]